MPRSRGRWVALGVMVLASHALLLGLGAWLRATPLNRLDEYGLEQVTRRFEPALAPGLSAALGPTLPFYAALVAFALFAALIRHWRRVPRSLLGAALGVALAFELAALGAAALPRPAPVVAAPELPIDAEWRTAWQSGGSYPNRHALLAASLAVSALIAWAPLGLASSGLALAGGATAVYFGVAYATDVLAALVLGAASAVAGRLGAGRVRFGRLE